MQPGPSGAEPQQGKVATRAQSSLKCPHHAQPGFDALYVPHPVLQQDGRTQGFMEPADRVTQALSASRVTWKKHISLEQLGESESPSPLAPIKHHPWHHSHSLCCKTTSHPTCPPPRPAPFKEPLKLIKGGSAQQTPRLDIPLPAQMLQEKQGRPGAPVQKGAEARAILHTCGPARLLSQHHGNQST